MLPGADMAVIAVFAAIAPPAAICMTVWLMGPTASTGQPALFERRRRCKLPDAASGSLRLCRHTELRRRARSLFHR